MRKLAIAAAVAAGLTPLALAALELTVNGQTISVPDNQVSLSYSAGALRVTVNDSRLSATAGSGGGGTPVNPNPTPTPDPDPTPTPTPDPDPAPSPTNCNTSGFTLDTTGFGPVASNTRVSLGTQVLATPFTSSSNPAYLGSFAIASTTGNSAVGREVWISECPNGDPLPNRYCFARGTAETLLRWQHRQNVSYSCTLELNKQYYLNMKNTNCGSGRCDVYRAVYARGTY